MPAVQFNSVEDFMAELRRDPTLVDRRILRVTNLYRRATTTPHIQFVSVVATASVAGEVVRLEAHCGSMWSWPNDVVPNGFVDDRSAAAASAVVNDQLRLLAIELELDVRAGMYVAAAE